MSYRRMDASNEGFGVQVSTKGKITFIFRYRSPVTGKDVPMQLGVYRMSGQQKIITSLSEGRERWRKWKSTLDTGLDPKLELERQQKAAEEAQREEERRLKIEKSRGTLLQLIDCYIDDMKKQGKHSWPEVEQGLTKDTWGHIPRDKKAKDVTSDDIRAVLSAIIARGAKSQATNVRAYFSAAFAFGINWDNDATQHLNPLQFAISFNPVRDIPKPQKTRVRKRTLSEAELRQFWLGLEASQVHYKTKMAIRLVYALGGQRVEEILKLTRSSINLPERYLIFWETKKGNNHAVPFCGIAEELLTEFLEQGTEEQLFDMPYQSLNQAVQRVRKREGMEPFVMRDAKGTVKTLLGKQGISLELRNRYQNHKSAFSDTGSKHYDQFDYMADKRRAAEAWNHQLQEILTGEVHNNIIPLKAVSSNAKLTH